MLPAAPPRNVCYRRKSEKLLLIRRSSQFDPEQKYNLSAKLTAKSKNTRRGRFELTSSTTVYKLHKLFNDKCLIANFFFHQIPNRNHSHHVSLFNNGKMAHSLFGHNGHTFFYRLIWPRKNDVRFHNIADGSCG